MTVYFPQPLRFREVSTNLKAMEQLSLNNGNGQSYGYIVYRKKLSIRQGSVLSMRGRPRDLLLVNKACLLLTTLFSIHHPLQVLVNGVMVNEPILKMADLSKFGSWAVK